MNSSQSPVRLEGTVQAAGQEGARSRAAITLVNPISGRGHLDAYARLYTRALVELDYSVVLIGETDGGVPHGEGTHVSFLPLTELERSGHSAIPPFDRTRPFASARAKLAHLYNRGGGIAVLEYAGLVLTNLARRGFGRSTRRIAFDIFIGGIGRPLDSKRRPALIIFLYLDMMENSARAVRTLEKMGEVPWVGIVFHPAGMNARYKGVERMFAARNARGAILLVPEAKKIYAQTLPRQTFALVPDVADLQLPANLPDWIKSLKAQAGERTIILQVGTISPHKGIKQLLDVIRMADTTRFFFAIVGEPHWDAFGEDKQPIQAFFAKPPENVYAKFGYVQSEAEYNALICACDIIYAVYQGFNSSSNSLTKAAGFQRRILVADRTLMSQRVLEARIGDVAPETNPEAIHAALQRLAKRPATDFDFDVYAAQHSLEALKKVLAEALPQWLNATDNAQKPTTNRTS